VTVAIPLALFFIASLCAAWEELVIGHGKQEATKLVEVMQGNREVEGAEQPVKVSPCRRTARGA